MCISGKKLTRVQPLLDHVRRISQELYQPLRNISADERMVGSRHQFSGIRQFCKDKPVRFGFKLWVLACTSTGYTYEFFVYLGKNGTELTDKAKGVAYNVVMDLVPRLTNQGYILFTDSFYTTFDLSRDLLRKGIYFVGTVRGNSSAMPIVFKNSVKDWERVSGRGDFRWVRDDKFVTVQWRDTKTVTVLSSMYSGSETAACKRTFRDRTGWKKTSVKQPKLVYEYNQGMGGVDLSNQMLSQYRTSVRTQYHWWKVLYFHCIDIMIVNSYIIFKECVSQYPTNYDVPARFGQLEFRESLIMSLLGLDCVHEVKKDCLPEFTESRIECMFCNSVASMEGTKVPRNRSAVCCSHCHVHLCICRERNCFSLWHSAEGERVRCWLDGNRKRKL
jgi:hypothetical protein